MTKSFYENPDIYDITHTKKADELLVEYYKDVFRGKKVKTIHDCSFGTGNLSIALSRMGYDLSGSDISEKMLEKARENIKNERLNIDLVHSDFRELTSNIKKTYDCVMCTGNSLAHVNNTDVRKTIHEMSKLVRSDGYIYLDTRNWDKIIDTKQRFYYYPPLFRDEERINFMQVWDHNIDGTIKFNLLYSFEKNNKILRHEEFEETYYPLKKETIENFLKEFGFYQIEIHNFINPKIKEFEDMQWYSIIARKSV